MTSFEVPLGSMGPGFPPQPGRCRVCYAPAAYRLAASHKAGCMQRVLADSSRRCAWTFTPGSRRCGAKHYTHEAEERNKIKFWFQYVQIEIQKIIIFIFSPLASQPLWLRVFRFQVASSKFLICESSDSLFFFCFLTLSACRPSSG